MKLEFQVTRNDMIAYQYAVRNRTREVLGSNKLSRLLWLAAAGAVLGVVLILLDNLMSALTGWAANPLSIFAGAISGVGTVIAIYSNNYLKLRQHKVRPGGPTLAPHVVETSDEAIAVRSPFLSANYKWSMFTGVTETRDIIVLWTEPLSGMIIPRAAFKDDAERLAFIEDARSRIAATAKP